MQLSAAGVHVDTSNTEPTKIDFSYDEHLVNCIHLKHGTRVGPVFAKPVQEVKPAERKQLTNGSKLLKDREDFIDL